MKKILAVTGIRSEYDYLHPVLKKFENRGFEVLVAVCGAHLSHLHGETCKVIEQDGFKIVDKIDYLLNTDRVVQRSKGVGLLIFGLTQTIEREKPDFLLVIGDREESIATCIIGNYMNILTIHYGGGDPVYGNSDDPIRLACSKLAHIHCTTTQEYANNLLKISEDNWRILNSGSTSYANIVSIPQKNRKEISDYLKLDLCSKNYIVFLKHPLSSEVEDAYRQMFIALDTACEFARQNNLYIIGIYPNSDPGSLGVLKAIQDLEQINQNVKFFKTIPRDIFVNLIRNSLCLVGNSSMGILEAPFYKLPVVNVGNRQKGRLNAGNVIFVNYDKEDIISALNKSCFDENYRSIVKKIKNPYGDETSVDKIVDFIDNIDLKDRKWYVKTKLC
ncbi:TPA: UDP-N-acetylglucosamine 2-epimerase (hydrolyzing) [Campylobacter jejuni]|uniref:UDP-N-acetylglucosamine 2-epimerase n=1 Tax=Campylobacter jejuni TaxID=197 RepID=UPI000F809BE3|nr:UDP-N-acetylglucosamine 2-epimerase [Campylobacter jejuni]RTJ88853.1 UDP-N-acetylglucosamine 2-epimerase (hydrolyzing) [Campylobacter jejuni]HED7286593.1 UDP-N-acetylglucosamine 2-epimerase (hydrolyzing) [Campylobacter jejuni]HEG2562082.1 UDP-N-acetylglucosamine 2-epimerase (hydrolyzing) [Campylobacter jejuni]HEG7986102.1 UDP-N-acetylglucosamine 2-epimerase (hydrolyzing) [Campylobacter jejuni]HEG8042558.1 UDP-N-acetylglucosamine 2-epimerase (hydrolyzing) [Campylobacter jejuni]